MKSNKELGYTETVQIEDYVVGISTTTRPQIARNRWRAYGHEWHGEQDASREFAHHEVCGRGETAEEAVENMIGAAIRAGEAGQEGGQDGLTKAQALRLRDQLLEELAEIDEATVAPKLR